MNQSASHRIVIASCVVLQTMLVMLCIAASQPARSADLRDDTILGHHVQMKGYGGAEIHEEQFAYQLKVCKGLKNDIETLPAGEKIHEMFRDIYYVPGAVTTYIVTKTYSYQPRPLCKLVQTKTEDIRIEVTGGFCNVYKEQMKAIGKCKIPLAQLGQKLSRLKLPFAGVATGAKRVIAGEECAVYENEYQKVVWRWCFAKKEFAAGLATGVGGAPGAPLSEETFNTDNPAKPVISLEAVNVESNTSIPLHTLLPQLAGNYQFLGGR